jgi:hypothetical protein
METTRFGTVWMAVTFLEQITAIQVRAISASID